MGDDQHEDFSKFTEFRIGETPREFPTRKIYLPPEAPYRELRKQLDPTYNDAVVRRIWSSEDGTLPAYLDDDVFSIKPDSTPRIILTERDFESNTKIVTGALGGPANTYFIGDNGTAHLFAVATALRRQGVDVAFNAKTPTIQGKNVIDIRTDTDSMLYYSDEYVKAKETPLLGNSMATMINFHRADCLNPYDLPPDAFPSIDLLRAQGIGRVILLSEDFDAERGIIRADETDLSNQLASYQHAGLSVMVVRVDSRQGRKRTDIL